MKKNLTLFLSLFLLLDLSAQNASLVNPFIGTDKSDIRTRWGLYGGTYPGAVAPWGAVQLSPETRKSGERGYFRSDSSIVFFTCVNHYSGYPEGSKGDIRVTFTPGHMAPVPAGQPFRNENESAVPGYYSVRFNDGSQVEMTASTRTGIFRYHPVKAPFVVSVSGAGDIKVNKAANAISVSGYNGVFIFNKPWKSYRLKDGLLLLEFDRMPGKEGLLVKAGFSAVNEEGSLKNLEAENPDWDFDGLKERTLQLWNSELDVVRVTGEHDDRVRFYTALYHSFLIPHVISDVDGRYRGVDGKVYHTGRPYAYGKFSTWDTFRSLHPLLCLLKPQRQLDMLWSMLSIYDQQGQLPHTPMTGYHSIPVFTDSYRKGIRAFDTGKAYRAMRKSLTGDSIPRADTYQYIRDGFLNDSVDESVSVTLDYAYNDWALSAFARETGHTADAGMFLERSFGYRNLFDPGTRFMLPRNESGFIPEPGEMGYKEADKWTASWFVPHNIQDLINLSGGDDLFVRHLDDAMRDGNIIHDNETVLNFPYLFSYAGRPDLTHRWVSQIRQVNYTSSPGGIPGNDDLGAMSSWFVFSAMGLYPVCPGVPEYVLATPLFRDIAIRLENGKTFQIKTQQDMGQQCFSLLKLNDADYRNLYLHHDQVMAGGELYFGTGRTTSGYSGFRRPFSVTAGIPRYHVIDMKLSPKKATPHQDIYVRFSVRNSGATGTFPAMITEDGQTIASKYILIEKDSMVTDSVMFRLYREGRHELTMAGYPGTNRITVQVLQAASPAQPVVCNELVVTPLVRVGEKVHIRAGLQNISGKAVSGKVPVYGRDTVCTLAYTLEPGETVLYDREIMLDGEGFHHLKVLDKTGKTKVYRHPVESCVLDIGFGQPCGQSVRDDSGFDNHGQICGPVQWSSKDRKAIRVSTQSYISFPLSESLDISGKTITMMAWVCPEKEGSDYIDFFTKGDYNVLKTDHQNLSFFAGGWGRGSCDTPLPSGWLNNWHHITGVCNGHELKVYINGQLKNTLVIEGGIEQTRIPWNLGRNAEMPYSRRYEGLFGRVRIFKEALPDGEILEIYNRER